jgi:hypothetical protein
MDKLLNFEYERILSNLSGASKGHIHPLIPTDDRKFPKQFSVLMHAQNVKTQ